VSVSGEDQIAVYDDSNLFVDRDGQLNANTGDTDSSGLNAVDVSGSIVRSGDHTEDGENGDNGEEPEEEDARPAGAPAAQPSAPNNQASDGPKASHGPRASHGHPAPHAGTASGGTQSKSNGQATSTVTDEGESSATGDSAFTIGADGYDNLGIDAQGKGNIVTYDDSNVVLGGAGDVNAQIGDSDTGGAVVMGIDDSDVRSGNST
jgi:hypothetical protein